MKTIKIRFIKECYTNKRLNRYRLQEKTLFGWRDVRLYLYGCARTYRHKNKSKLLELVVKNYYNRCMEHVKIVEYPMIKVCKYY